MYIFNYNGYTVQNDTSHAINKTSGLNRVPTRVSSDVLTGGHGGNIWEEKYDMRPITIGGTLFGSTLATYFARWNTFSAAFACDNTSRVLTVTRGDGVVKYINCKVVDLPSFVESEGDWATATFEVLLKAEDPFFYTANQTFTMTLSATGGGVPISAPIASPIGSGVTTNLILNNQGNVSTYASFTFTGACSTPTITNATTSQSMTLATMVASDIIQVYRDTQGLHVLRNGVTDFTALVSGDLPIIQSGLNVLTFTAGTYSATASVAVVYNDKFLTI